MHPCWPYIKICSNFFPFGVWSLVRFFSICKKPIFSNGCRKLWLVKAHGLMMMMFRDSAKIFLIEAFLLLIRLFWDVSTINRFLFVFLPTDRKLWYFVCESLCYFSIKYCLTETSTSTIAFSGVRTIDTKALYNCLLPLCCIFTAVSRIWLTGKYTGVTFWDVTFSLLSWVSGTVHVGKRTHLGIFLGWLCKMRHPSPLGCLTRVSLESWDFGWGHFVIPFILTWHFPPGYACLIKVLVLGTDVLRVVLVVCNSDENGQTDVFSAYIYM